MSKAGLDAEVGAPKRPPRPSRARWYILAGPARAVHGPDLSRGQLGLAERRQGPAGGPHDACDDHRPFRRGHRPPRPVLLPRLLAGARGDHRPDPGPGPDRPGEQYVEVEQRQGTATYCCWAALVLAVGIRLDQGHPPAQTADHVQTSALDYPAAPQAVLERPADGHEKRQPLMRRLGEQMRIEGDQMAGW